MRKLALLTALAGTLALTAGAAVAGSGKQAVKVGSYTGAPKIKSGSYSEGEWAVARKQGKRVMVVAPGFNGIYYPDAGKCDNYSLPITKTEVPIGKKGTFHVKEKTPVVTPQGEKKVSVDWRGRWTSATKVKGTIKLGFKRCSDKRGFTGQYAG